MSEEAEVLGTIEQLLDTFRAPAVMVHRPYSPLGLPPTRSRLGGLPLLPDAFEWPKGRSTIGEGEIPLHFLAQIDCAELPRIDAAMPTQGMLFFFGRDDEEQLWGDTKPHDDARIIYAPRVSPDQRERPAPAALPPIRGEFYRGSPFPLPGDSGPSVHASWPVALLPIDTWPDVSALLENKIFRKAVLSCRPYFEKIGRFEKVIDKDPLWAAVLEFDRAREPFGELYDQRLNALRLGTIASATGQTPPAKAKPDWPSGFKQGSRLAFDPSPNSRPFPQVAVMIDRIARLIVLQATSLLDHRDYQNEEKRQPLERTKETGLYWVNRCKEIGPEIIPSQADAQGFASWLKQLSGDPSIVSDNGPTIYSPYLRGGLNDIFSKAILSTIQYAAQSPKVAAAIPASFYDAFADQHLPFAFRFGSKILSPEFHQMLGHDRSCQDAKPVDSGAVLLLQLGDDDVLNMGFGDVGSASFWIERKDLEQLRFENAWGEIVGH